MEETRAEAEQAIEDLNQNSLSGSSPLPIASIVIAGLALLEYYTSILYYIHMLRSWFVLYFLVFLLHSLGITSRI